MIRRRDSLAATLAEIDAGALQGVAVIVVSSAWWAEIAVGEQEVLRRRCEAHGVALHTDDRLSRHYVELGSAPLGAPLSSERRL